MSFLDKMKAANGFSLGRVESPDFPACALISKNNQLYITGASLNTKVDDYLVEDKNVVEFRIIGGGGNWAKYYILFKDGKSAVITQTITTEKRQRETSIRMAPIERFLKIKDRLLVNSSFDNVNDITNQKNAVISEKIKENSSRPDRNDHFTNDIQKTFDPIKVGDQVIAIQDMQIENTFIKKGDVGIVENTLRGLGGLYFLVKLNNGKSINISERFLNLHKK